MLFSIEPGRVLLTLTVSPLAPLQHMLHENPGDKSLRIKTVEELQRLASRTYPSGPDHPKPLPPDLEDCNLLQR